MTSGVRPYQAVHTRDSEVAHYWETWDGRELTLCGRANPSEGFTLGRGGRRLCHTCHRIAVARLQPSLPSEKAMTAARALVSALTERDDARVWEIAGESGVYLVCVLPGQSTCTCMSGKTRPLELCKHQAAAFLSMAEEPAESEGVAA